MSRINDALKRAQNAQQNNPPPHGGPQMQPVSPEQAATRGIGLALPFAFVLIALVGLLFVWQIRQKHAAQNTSPAESRSVTVAPAAPPKVVVVSSTVKPISPAPVEEPMAQTAIAPAPPAQPVARPLPAPAPVPAAPPALKLQGILFSGSSSSALINGQSVMTGDRVGEYRVRIISQRSVTLVSATRTNVLTLNQ